MRTYVLNVNCIHVLIWDLDASLVDVFVKLASNGQSRISGSGLDQINNGLHINEWFTLPVFRNVAKQAMLNFIIFGCPRRVVDDLDFLSYFIGSEK